MRLVQKHLIKGTREFELLDDEIRVRISSAFTSKEKSVSLAILNPEPQIDGDYLHFHSRVKCGPLLSLYLNKPNAQEFNEFVNAVKTRALKEFNAFAGLDGK